MNRYPRLAGWVIRVVLANLWEVATRYRLAPGRLMPPPSRLAATAWSLARSGELQTHIIATMTRVLAGFAIGVDPARRLNMTTLP